MQFIDTMNYYTAAEINALKFHASTRLSLKNITLNEKHQWQKGTVSVIQLELIIRPQRAMLHVVYGYTHIHYIYENWKKRAWK